MNYITTSYTINTTRINLIWETTQNIQVLVNQIQKNKTRTLVRNCKHNTFRIGSRHNMQIHNPQDRLHYTSSKKNKNFYYIDTPRLKRNS